MEKIMPYALEELKEVADLLQRLTPEQKRQFEKTIEDIRPDDNIRRILDAMDYEETVATYRIMMQFVMLPPARQENILRISDELLKQQQAEEKPTDDQIGRPEHPTNPATSPRSLPHYRPSSGNPSRAKEEQHET